MDFLSYLTIKKYPAFSLNVVVLNSVANLDKAIPFLQCNNNIHLFLDHDEAGRKATAEIVNRCPQSEVIDLSGFYLGYKDVNDYLRAKTRPRHAPSVHSAPGKPGPKVGSTAFQIVRRQFVATSGHKLLLSSTPFGREEKCNHSVLAIFHPLKNTTMKREIIKFRCDTEERRTISDRAEKAGVTLSEYCRRQVLYGKIIATPQLTAEEQEYFRMLQTHNSFMTRLANLFTYKDPAFNKEA